MAFSFGQRDSEPSPANLALAKATKRAMEAQPGPAEVVAQWEVAKGLEEIGIHPDLIVGPPKQNQYIDSEKVWSVARDRFLRDGVIEVVPIAQPFLHLRKVRHLVKRDGMHPVKFDPGRIGFDNSSANVQRWTRGRLALLWYSIQQLLTGRRGEKK